MREAAWSRSSGHLLPLGQHQVLRAARSTDRTTEAADDDNHLNIAQLPQEVQNTTASGRHRSKTVPKDAHGQQQLDQERPVLEVLGGRPHGLPVAHPLYLVLEVGYHRRGRAGLIGWT